MPHCRESVWPWKWHLLRSRGFLRKMRGGSQAILAEASDGLVYVVKFPNNLQGPNVLLNECVGNQLYRVCGLPCSDWKAFDVSDQFIEENPGCWIFNNQKPVQPVSGLAFGSRFIGGAGVRLWEILPGSWFQRVQNPHNFWRAWLIDACLGHADNRQVVFQEWKVGSLKPCFIDHGFLFGGADGTHRPKAARSRYLDPRVYGNAPVPQLSKYAKTIHEVFPEILRSLVQDVPAQWKTTSAIASFERYVERTYPNLDYVKAFLMRFCKPTVTFLTRKRLNLVRFLHRHLPGFRFGCPLLNCEKRRRVFRLAIQIQPEEPSRRPHASSMDRHLAQ